MNTPDRSHPIDELFAMTPPAEPSPLAWVRVQERIHAEVAAAAKRRARLRFATLLTASAASLFVAFLSAMRPDSVDAFADHGDVDRLAMLPIASAEDVEIESFGGPSWHALPVGDPHVPGSLVLAAADDLRVESADRELWPNGEPRITLTPGDAPVLYAMQTE